MGPTPKAKQTISLSGAGVQGANKTPGQEIDFTKTNENYIDNLIDKKVVLNSEVNKVDPEATTEIDFTKEDYVNKITASKTKQSTNSTADDWFKNKSTDQIQQQLKEEEEKSKNIDPGTFVEIARFIIFLIDASAAAFFKWWSGDTSDSQYSLSKPKQEQLVRQLATILIKYQAKFSIEFMFLISVLILYIPAFTLAKGNRKDNKAKKPSQPPNKQTTTPAPVYQEPTVEIKNKKTTIVYETKPAEEFKPQTTEELITTVEPLVVVEEPKTELVIAKPEKKKTRPRKAN